MHYRGSVNESCAGSSTVDRRRVAWLRYHCWEECRRNYGLISSWAGRGYFQAASRPGAPVGLGEKKKARGMRLSLLRRSNKKGRSQENQTQKNSAEEASNM